MENLRWLCSPFGKRVVDIAVPKLTFLEYSKTQRQCYQAKEGNEPGDRRRGTFVVYYFFVARLSRTVADDSCGRLIYAIHLGVCKLPWAFICS